MNEASAKAASKDDAEGVHRLRDIVVEEVSLVDRAANQRRFLVVKRSAEMADESTASADTKPDTPNAIQKAKKKPAAARADEPVDEVKAKKPVDDEADDAEDTEKARRAPKDEDTEDDEDDAGKKKQQKADDGLVLAASLKETLLGVLTQALERLMTLASSIKDATEPDDGADSTMPDDVGEELTAIAEMLSGVDKRKKTKADVTKAGARMSKDRLDRFQKALALLADILKELTDAKETPANPTAGAAESGLKKRDAAPPTAPTIPGLQELVTGIGELTRVVKRQEEELGRMRQARGVSNAIPIESGRRAEQPDVSWPLDMNRPISRDKVRKETSFFEE